MWYNYTNTIQQRQGSHGFKSNSQCACLITMHICILDIVVQSSKYLINNTLVMLRNYWKDMRNTYMRNLNYIMQMNYNFSFTSQAWA